VAVDSYRSATDADALSALSTALCAANQAVYSTSRTDPEHKGMGTTCTAVVVKGSHAFIGHVGDSRAYLVRNGDIRQLTQDHSLVAELVRDNQLTAEQARDDPRRHIITRCLGIDEEVEVDLEQLDTDLVPDDTLIICSDGLHSAVTDAEIAELASRRSLEQACQELIALANARGGSDNITVVLARVQKLQDTRRLPVTSLTAVDVRAE
jgi:protein phosphatase